MTWQNIKYGWVAIAGLAIIGTTIYVSDNTRRQVNAVDIIEIVLGTHERCLATQYGTNALGEPLYHVAPPAFIRSFTDGSNTVVKTNAFGWMVDRTILVDLDSTIKELVPYYWNVEFNAPYSVTGLWASLQIGDGTNLFTSEPAGITSSNASFGSYVWQLYPEALVERYKVLHMLKVIKYEAGASISEVSGSYRVKQVGIPDMFHPMYTDIDLLKGDVESAWVVKSTNLTTQTPAGQGSHIVVVEDSLTGLIYYKAGLRSSMFDYVVTVPEIDTNSRPWCASRTDLGYALIDGAVSIFTIYVNPREYLWSCMESGFPVEDVMYTRQIVYSNKINAGEVSFSITNTLGVMDKPTWGPTPAPYINPGTPFHSLYGWSAASLGVISYSYAFGDFSYCVHKFW